MIRLIFKLILIIMLLLSLALCFGNDVLVNLDPQTRLPSSGPNFETYSCALSTIGRTHVHEKLKPVLLDSYKRLETSEPQVRWIFAETGWKNGGPFWPHRTHQDGLSVDFIVPVVDRDSGKPTTLSLWPHNLWGYRLRFSDDGIYDSVQINFGAIISHLKALNDACAQKGLRIKRLIFDPPLLAKLRKHKRFAEIHNIPFMDGRAWVPHDSHYHVDFAINL